MIDEPEHVDADDVEDGAIGDRLTFRELALRLDLDESIYGASFFTIVDGWPRRIDPLEYVHVWERDDDESRDGPVEPPAVDPLFEDGDDADSIHGDEQPENEPRGDRFADTHEHAQNEGSSDSRDGGISRGGVINSTAAELTTRAPSAAESTPPYGAPQITAESFAVDTPDISTPVLDKAVERIAKRRISRACRRCGLIIRPEDVEWVDGEPRCPVHGTPIPPSRGSE